MFDTNFTPNRAELQGSALLWRWENGEETMSREPKIQWCIPLNGLQEILNNTNGEHFFFGSNCPET